MPQGTHEDAKLILQLYDLRREERMRKAREWMGSEFRATTLEEAMKVAPPGSGMNASYRMVTTYWDMVATFIVNGVLNQELFFQSGRELLFTWEKVKPVVLEMRVARKNPNILKNLEKAGNDFAAWVIANDGQEAYDEFVKMVRPPR